MVFLCKINFNCLYLYLTSYMYNDIIYIFLCAMGKFELIQKNKRRDIMFGNIFHIQRFSLFDGPGVRTVVFLKGCSMRCIWCHNPEGIERKSQLMYNPAKCIGCGECVNACPLMLHSMREGLHHFIRTDCICCGKCAEVCCSGALSMVGQMMDVGTVIATVMRDLPVYRESGGGMTLSGGEPFNQPEFSIALLKEAKNLGINTCVETCGQTSTETILEAAKFTDYFYYDYKATGNENHKRLCGVSQELILCNLAKLDQLNANVTLRCPIVPGQNETTEHIEGIGRTAALHSCIREVHIEPYHRLGISKAQHLGQQAAYDGCVPERIQLENYCEKIREISGKNCIIS